MGTKLGVTPYLSLNEETVNLKSNGANYIQPSRSWRTGSTAAGARMHGELGRGGYCRPIPIYKFDICLSYLYILFMLALSFSTPI